MSSQATDQWPAARFYALLLLLLHHRDDLGLGRALQLKTHTLEAAGHSRGGRRRVISGARRPAIASLNAHSVRRQHDVYETEHGSRDEGAQFRRHGLLRK